MWAWLHEHSLLLFGASVTPAVIMAFCDLLVQTWFNLMFGKNRMRLVWSWRDNVVDRREGDT